MKVLVTGGAGYIGSHMAKGLARAGHDVTVFDNLSTGHRDAVRYGRLVEGDLRDPASLARVFAAADFDAVMHFAGSCYVGESMLLPEKYHDNNVTGSRNLLRAMQAAGARRLVFSSSCATYGAPQRQPIDETQVQRPVNPYGATKLAAERAMRDAAASGLRTIALRYFNAAGCDPEGELGERHEPETHLIPLVLREALRLKGGGNPLETSLLVHGDDFDTADGTCVRDYVHVADLCGAHLAALDRLCAAKSEDFEAFNLGNECGHTVRQIVEICRATTGADIRFRVGPRRPGDPAVLVANSRMARTELGWTPGFPDISSIVATAWAWLARQ